MGTIYPMWVKDQDGRSVLAQNHERHSDIVGHQIGPDGERVETLAERVARINAEEAQREADKTKDPLDFG